MRKDTVQEMLDEEKEWEEPIILKDKEKKPRMSKWELRTIFEEKHP